MKITRREFIGLALGGMGLWVAERLPRGISGRREEEQVEDNDSLRAVRPTFGVWGGDWWSLYTLDYLARLGPSAAAPSPLLSGYGEWARALPAETYGTAFHVLAKDGDFLRRASLDSGKFRIDTGRARWTFDGELTRSTWQLAHSHEEFPWAGEFWVEVDRRSVIFELRETGEGDNLDDMC